MGQAPTTQRVLVQYDDLKSQWNVSKQNTPGGNYNTVSNYDVKKEAVKEARKVAKGMPRGFIGVLRVYTKSGRLSEETRYD